ncbi:MAG: AmmeMemoRadiSam system protein B [bacterium]
MDYPKLRNIEAFPVQNGLIGLRDPYNFTNKILVVPPNIFYIISLFDGHHSILDIQSEYTRRYGNLLFSNKVKEIIEQLDDNLFLEGERFEAFKREVEEEFRRAKIRPASHVGTAYEADPEALKRQLEGLFSSPEGPGVPDTGSPSGRLKGIIAPHIDLRRGGLCFAWAYGELARESDARTFVVLGISHVDTRNRFILTAKDFETPLGIMHTDGDFVERLAKGCSVDLFADEFVHKYEHSIEFQALFLKYLFPDRSDLRIVPILCSSFHRMILEGRSPSEDGEVREFLDSLRRIMKEEERGICLIAAADLSHVGPRFGDRQPLSPGFIGLVEGEDRRMLEKVLARDAEGFFQFIQKDRDRRRVCGVPAIYTLLSLLGAGEAKLLRYDKAVDYGAQSAITFAGVALYG